MNKKQLLAEIKELKEELVVCDTIIKTGKKEIKEAALMIPDIKAELKFRQK